MLKKMLLGFVILFTGATMVLAFLQTYRIREGAAAELLWNSEGGYLFVDVASRGYHLSYLRYLSYCARERFGDIAMPSDQRSSVIVVQIHPEGVRRYEVKDAALNFYAPFQGNIYARGNIYANGQGPLWKWAGDHFEQANPEEKQRFESSRPELVHFTSLDGWSKAFNVLNRRNGETVFPMTIGGKAFPVVAGINITTGEEFVDVTRPGQAPERIWYSDGRARKVSRVEYEKAFPKP